MLIENCLRVYKLFKSEGRRIISNVCSRGGSITSLELLVSLKNYSKTFSTIIDVGANKGQFALAARLIYPNASIYSFEPLPDVFKNLITNTKKFNNIRAYNYALGSKCGKINFYKHEYSPSSSALKQINLAHPSKASVIEVELESLDLILKNIELKHPLLLKLDVQGFEKEVLKGAKNLLTQVDYLLFETSFTYSYENEPLFGEMHDYVRNIGFKLIAPVGLLEIGNRKFIQMDVLYKNNEN